MRKVKLVNSDCHTDGKIQLLLSGFGQQDLLTIDDIIASVKKVPARHLAGLKKIHYDPSRLHQMLYYYLNIAPNLRSLGEFIQQSRKINIYQFKDKKQFYHTLYHEIGHYVYFFIIDSVLKKQWATKTHRKEGFISNYASKNAAEDFAECYSFYMTSPEKLKPFKIKHSFIHKKVFDNEKNILTKKKIDLLM